MSNGVKGAGANPAPVTIAPQDVPKTKADASPQGVTTEKKEEPQKPPAPTGKSAEGIASDPSTAIRKGNLNKMVGLTKPTKAQLEEIRSAIKDGKKDEAIKLTIKYYNIDTSGAQEVKYVAGGKTPEAEGHAQAKNVEHIGTGTHKRGGKISIEIGDESFQFQGKDSPEWLAGAIYHESFHAKNHFKSDKPVIVRDAANASGSDAPKMTQQEIAEEIQAYANEEKAAGKLGMSSEMLAEVADRRNKLYAQLTPENREILRPILRGTQPWPE